MKFNTVLVVGLGALSLNMGAADPSQQKIRVINKTGYDIELQVGRLDEGQGYRGTKYTYPDVKAGGDHTIDNASRVNQLGVRFKYTTMGYPNNDAAYDPIDVSDLKQHPGDTLVISIESALGGYGFWNFERHWMKPAEGLRIEEDWEDLGEVQEPKQKPAPVLQPIPGVTPREILGVSDEATKKDIRKAYQRLILANHPDKNPGNTGVATENTKKINDAYNKLK